MQIKVQHNLSLQEATHRVQTLIQKLKSNYAADVSSLKENWNGNTGEFQLFVKKLKVSGNVDILNKQVNLKINLPLAALIFKNKLKLLITDEIKKVLS